MQRTLFILLFAIICSGHAFAADNICSVAGPFVNSTSIQIDGFADKNALRTFDGSGSIRDVRSGGLASKFTFIVDCGNNVLVEVPTSSPQALNGAKIGDSISFSGKFNGMSRRRYVNTHTWYLMVSLADNASVY